MFDPYYQWLGIPPEERPINHYRLLGLRLYEDNLEVIESAAERQMSHVRKYATGPHSEQSQQVLNMLATARLTLIKPDKRAAYDQELRSAAQGVAVKPEPGQWRIDTSAPAALAPSPRPLAPPKAERSNAGLLIGLGIGGGVALLLVIGLILWSESPSASTDPAELADAVPNTLAEPVGVESTAPVARPSPMPPETRPVPNFSKPAPPPLEGPSPEPLPQFPAIPASQEMPLDEAPAKTFALPHRVAAAPLRVVHRPAYPSGKKILIVADNREETQLAVRLCERFGLPCQTAMSFVDGQTDFSPYHTVVALANRMDYWAKKDHEPVKIAMADALEAFVSEGGHFCIFGSYNARGTNSLKRYGIRTGFNHNGQFVPSEPHTSLLFHGMSAIVPENKKLTSAGNFSVEPGKTHVVWLNRSKGNEPKFVSILHGQGLVSYNLVEPHWQKDFWFQEVVFTWLSRRAPMYETPGQNFSVAQAKAKSLEPIPGRVAQEAARQVVLQAYSIDEAAETGPGPEVVAEMLTEAKKMNPTQDSALHFVLLDEAYRHAISAQEFALALDAVDALAERYDVDRLALRATVASKIATTRLSADTRGPLHARLLPALKQALAEDRMDVVKALAEALDESSQRARDIATIDALFALRKEIAQRVALWQAEHEARNRLAESPTDPEAHTVLGRQLCFVRGAWDEGLGHLALGSDPVLKELAVADLQVDDDATAQRALAEQWLAAGAALGQAEQISARGRAAQWLHTARWKLDGEARAEVEAALDGLATETPAESR